uniref:Thyrotropin-releasing hormone receptor n=2 Tax=Cacopsylla melanoneura TaxID=428564 RepID=A0A8D9B780_9HEMI
MNSTASLNDFYFNESTRAGGNASEGAAGINTLWPQQTPRPEMKFIELLQLYYTPLLVGLGSIGNILSVFVFFGTKLRKLSSSYYLSALASSDTGFLVTLFAVWLNMIDIPWFTNDGICQISIYLTYVCSFLSVWFVVAFTIERFIAVRYPLHRPSMCTVARAKVILISLTLLALALYSPYLFISGPQINLDTRQNTTIVYCGLVQKWKDLATLLNHVDFILTLIVPFSLIVVLNTLISRTVWRVARIRRSMINNNNNNKLGVGGTTSAGSVNHHHQSVRNNLTSHNTQKMFQNSRRNSAGNSSQTKVTKMLLIVSSVFICLNLPSYTMRFMIFINETLQYESEETQNNVVMWQHYCQILFNTNFGINFALYCISGQNFRRSLVALFCKTKRNKRARREMSQTTVLTDYAGGGRYGNSMKRKHTIQTDSLLSIREDMA